jgi:hypothetical protein
LAPLDAISMPPTELVERIRRTAIAVTDVAA